jgi:hypothetical protein
MAEINIDYAVVPPTDRMGALVIKNFNFRRQGGASKENPLKYDLVAEFDDYNEAVRYAISMNERDTSDWHYRERDWHYREREND